MVAVKTEDEASDKTTAGGAAAATGGDEGGEGEEDARLRGEAYRAALGRVFGEVREALYEERLRAVQAEIEQARSDTHPLLVAQQQEMTDMEGERVWAAEQHHALQLAEMAALCEQECAFARRDADIAQAAAQERLVADLVARRQHACDAARRLVLDPARPTGAASSSRGAARGTGRAAAAAPYALPAAPMAPLVVSGLATPALVGAQLSAGDIADDLRCMEHAVLLATSSPQNS